jgi:hypothetical protein
MTGTDTNGAIPGRPGPEDCNAYYFAYIDRVPDGDVLALLARQRRDTAAWLASLDDDVWARRYAPDKWSVKEIVNHLIDAERAFSFRAFTAARRDPAPLPSFEQDDYVAASGVGERSPASIVEEYEAVRAASLVMFRTFGPDAWASRGNASGWDFAVRSIPYILAGHEIHHLGVIRERYL